MALTCQATSLDGHPHEGALTEYVGVCVRGHERRGWVCEACAGPGPDSVRGPRAVRCAECPDDDPRPRVLVPAGIWGAT